MLGKCFYYSCLSCLFCSLLQNKLLEPVRHTFQSSIATSSLGLMKHRMAQLLLLFLVYPSSLDIVESNYDNDRLLSETLTILRLWCDAMRCDDDETVEEWKYNIIRRGDTCKRWMARAGILGLWTDEFDAVDVLLFSMVFNTWDHNRLVKWFGALFGSTSFTTSSCWHWLDKRDWLCWCVCWLESRNSVALSPLNLALYSL